MVEKQHSGLSAVKSASRVLDVLELLAQHQQGLTFPELVELLGFPKSSLHALLWTLHDRGWVALDEDTRRYRTGVRAWEAGQGFVHGVDLVRVADRHLRNARADLDETVQLAILDGTDVVYVAKVDADHPFQLISRVGMRLPAYATGLGKVLLAALPPAELEARFEAFDFERFTDRTLTSFPELVDRLAQIRQDGFGEDDGEYTEGIFCVAAPVRDHTGAVVAALSCSAPRARLDAREVDPGRIRELVRAHGNALSTELGWSGTTSGTNLRIPNARR